MVSAPNGASGAVAASEDKQARVSMHGYDYSNKLATTLRFGECSPFLSIDAVPHDNLSIRNAHVLRTLSLKSPLMQDLKMNKDYFAVPKRALLPRNWDKIYNNPVFGDDIDASLHNTLIYLGRVTDSPLGGTSQYGYGILKVLDKLIENTAIATNGSFSSDFSDLRLIEFFRLLALYDSVFSKDSLAAALGIPIADRYGDNLAYEIQDVLDALWVCYHQMLEYIATNLPASSYVSFLDDVGNVVYVRYYDFGTVSGRMEFYYDFLENPNATLGLSDANALSVLTAGVAGDAAELLTYLDRAKNTRFPVVFEAGTNGKTWLNIDVLIAYQLIMAEYQTNDKIDQVFSADMLRTLYESHPSSNQSSGSQSVSEYSFEYNGEWYPYDGFSAFNLAYLASLAGLTTYTVRNYALWLNLFTRKRSLRYVDYFVGAKRSPLAVGDTNVTVNSNQVDVVDITRNIQLQRFLNQVNRVGQKAKHYLKGIFGTTERTRTDVPVKLAHTDEIIYGIETQNTGAAQVSDSQTITTNLSSRSSDFAFEMNFEEPTIVMGICSFEITRFYDRAMSPFASKVDRFDMFNPMMQYVGDQELPLKELLASAPDSAIFGYTTRNMEYKTRVDYCSGAFRDELKSWVFHDKDHLYSPTKSLSIDADYIRAHQCELDEYYLAMTGTDPLHRYHFIVLFSNNVKAERNMVPAPEIIG